MKKLSLLFLLIYAKLLYSVDIETLTINDQVVITLSKEGKNYTGATVVIQDSKNRQHADQRTLTSESFRRKGHAKKRQVEVEKNVKMHLKGVTKLSGGDSPAAEKIANKLGFKKISPSNYTKDVK